MSWTYEEAVQIVGSILQHMEVDNEGRYNLNTVAIAFFDRVGEDLERFLDAQRVPLDLFVSHVSSVIGRMLTIQLGSGRPTHILAARACYSATDSGQGGFQETAMQPTHAQRVPPHLETSAARSFVPISSVPPVTVAPPVYRPYAFTGHIVGPSPPPYAPVPVRSIPVHEGVPIIVREAGIISPELPPLPVMSSGPVAMMARSSAENTEKATGSAPRFISIKELYRRIVVILQSRPQGVTLLTLEEELLNSGENVRLHPMAASDFRGFIHAAIQTGELTALVEPATIHLDGLGLTLQQPTREGSNPGRSSSTDGVDSSEEENEELDDDLLDEARDLDPVDRSSANVECLKKWGGDLPELPTIVDFLRRLSFHQKEFRFATWQQEFRNIAGGDFDYVGMGLLYPGELITRNMLVPVDDTYQKIRVADCIIRANVINLADVNEDVASVIQYLMHEPDNVANQRQIMSKLGLDCNQMFNVCHSLDNVLKLDKLRGVFLLPNLLIITGRREKTRSA